MATPPKKRPAAPTSDRNAWRDDFVERRHRLEDVLGGAYAFQQVMGRRGVMDLLKENPLRRDGYSDNVGLTHAAAQLEWLAGRLSDPSIMAQAGEISSAILTGRPPLDQLDQLVKDIIRLCGAKLGLSEPQRLQDGKCVEQSKDALSHDEVSGAGAGESTIEPTIEPKDLIALHVAAHLFDDVEQKTIRDWIKKGWLPVYGPDNLPSRSKCEELRVNGILPKRRRPRKSDAQ